MDMNATDMLYEKMAYEFAYGDMMSYGPAPLTSPMSERFVGSEFIGYDHQHHGVNNISFEQGATRHGTRYSDTGSSPSLPSDIAADGLKTLRSPSDLVERVDYVQPGLPNKKSSLGSGNIVRGTVGEEHFTKGHSGPDDRANAQMGDMVKSMTKGGGHATHTKEGGQPTKEGGQLNQLRKFKEKPLCNICGQVTNIFASFIVSHKH